MKHSLTRAAVASAVAAAASFGTSAPAQAASDLYIGFPPGGGQYIMGQALHNKFPSELRMVIKPGAQGVIALNECTKAPASLCIVTQGQAVYAYADPVLSANVKYKPSDYQFVLGLGRSPVVAFTANKDLTLQGLKGREIKFGAGTAGLRSGMEDMVAKMGLNAVIANYSGVGPSVNDALGGHVDVAMAPWTVVAPQILNGKLKVIATTDSDHPALKGVPRFKDVGVFIADTSFAIITNDPSQPIIDKIRQWMKTPEYKALLQTLDVEAYPETHNIADEFASHLKRVTGK